MSLCQQWVTGADVKVRPGLAEVDDAVAEGAAEDASGLLYALTGRKFPGACTVSIAPMARPTDMNPRAYFDWLASFGVGWTSSGMPWGMCYGGDHAGCDQLRRIRLPYYPIRSIQSVTINGVAVDPSAYSIQDYRTLARTDGDTWPTCLNYTADGGFLITLAYGEDPPPEVLGACTTFAAELAKARSSLKNRLPSRVNSITREGVSMTILDPMPFIQNGMTGIYEVDLVIKAHNPVGASAPTVVYSPDLQQFRQPRTMYP